MKRRIVVVLLVVAVLGAMTAALALADAHEAMVSIGHGIPGADVDAALPEMLPVDVIVDGECLLQDFEFGEFAGPLALAPGSYEVAVALSDGDPELCEGDVVIGPVSLTFEGGDNVTVFAHLDMDGNPTATVFDNDVSPIVAGHTRLTIRHTAWAPAVDIDLNRGWIRGRMIAEVEGLENPNESEPVDVRPGAYVVSIFPAGEEEAVFQIPATEKDKPFVTKPHDSQIVYAVGSLENETFTVMVQVLDLEHMPPPRPMAE